MGLTQAITSRQWLLPSDPDSVALRRAVRAALVIPAAFAFAKIAIGNSQVVIFVAFGCFALMVMADFGGPARSRALAYVSTTATGALLILIGTLASSTTWSATAAMIVLGFSIQFAGVFGGYVSASQTALFLSLILAVTIPASTAEIVPRLAGWAGAGVVATLAALLLWPQFERRALYRKAATACRALADLVEALCCLVEPPEFAQVHSRAAAAADFVHQEYAVGPRRPAGPARRERAFVELLSEIQEVAAYCLEPLAPETWRRQPHVDACSILAGASAETLRASAEALDNGPPPDLDRLAEARWAHRQALDQWAEESLHAGAEPGQVLESLDSDHAFRLLSYLVMALGANAAIVAGESSNQGPLPPAGAPLPKGFSSLLSRILATIRTHLEPASSLLHNSIRTAVGLGLAVLVTRWLQLDHAFWVVLGTLSVLRSNAMATGRTTFQALAGTLGGFAVGGLLAGSLGGESVGIWLALPATVFLASYAPSAMGFIVGQAAFTLNVIILFNLISPVGWQVGLLRIQDVAIGVAISVVVGFLLWPRGARNELRRNTAAMCRSTANFLDQSFDRLLGVSQPIPPGVTRETAIRARDRAGEALDQYLAERGAKPLSNQLAAVLVASGTHAILAGDLLNVIADAGYEASQLSPAARELSRQSELVAVAFTDLAERLDKGEVTDGTRVATSDADLRAAAMAGLQEWKHNPGAERAAIAMVTAREWIHELSILATRLRGPVKAAAKAAHTPWWR